MRKFLLFTVVGILYAGTIIAQRINTTITTGWYFHKGDISLAEKDFSSDSWEKINLPHTWNSRDAFDEEKGYYRGIGWYAKQLSVPAQWENRNVILHFEGANQVAEVFVNGILAGKHTGGYTAFNFDITSLLKFGENNLLQVKLDNKHDPDIPPLNADFTFYGGIYRNVRLLVTEPVRFDVTNLASSGVFIETPLVNSQQASVTVRGNVVNHSKVNKKLLVETILYDKNGQEIAKKSVKIDVKAAEKAPFQIKDLTVTNPELWSPESPYLYQSITRIIEQGKTAVAYDEFTHPVGFRWFEFNGNEGFKLNGKKYSLKGVNRHQDFAGKGNALPDIYHSNDFARIKSLGFNFVRLAHYPQAPEVYRMCDELGLLVWTEIPIVNEVTDTEAFTENCLNMMREQIRQTCNHPSVILYGYMNEILIRMLSNKRLTEPERTKIAGITRDLALKLEALTKEEAPTRNTVMAIHYEDGYNHYEVSTITDVVGYNLYFGWYYEELQDLTRHLEKEHALYPGRPIILSEFGPGVDVRNHTKVPRPWDFSEEYQIVMHTSYLDQMAALPYLAGYALWNFADFGAEHRADAIPFINQKGIVNYDRSDKDVVGLYRATNLIEPVLQFASRNYTSRCGVETEAGTGICVDPITVFSNGNTIELTLNGKRIGQKEVVSRQAGFDVPFVHGENILEAQDNRGNTDRLLIHYNVIPINLSSWKGDAMAVNVGSYQTFVDPETKIVWIPDRQYTPGSWGRIGGTVFQRNDRQIKIGISDNILGTHCNPLFQTFVQGIERYRFDVKDGIYCITLCFVENNTRAPTTDIVYNLSGPEADKKQDGAREFDVIINGTTVIDPLNLSRDYGNLQAVQFDVTAQAINNSGIEVAFKPIAGKTTLSGIRIHKLQ
ncbi:beta-galactosidase [Bacteroidia bacterium]|nr:beta-galactosidase [Bacteroidia bacterium]